MWGSIMAVNSFFVWPLSFIFLIYSIGRMVMFFEWKLFLLAVVVFVLTTFAQMAISMLAD